MYTANSAKQKKNDIRIIWLNCNTRAPFKTCIGSYIKNGIVSSFKNEFQIVNASRLESDKLLHYKASLNSFTTW